MRTLLTRDKGRNSLADLVEGLPSFRIECSRDEGPVLVGPLPTFHWQESHLDGGQCLVLSDTVLLTCSAGAGPAVLTSVHDVPTP